MRLNSKPLLLAGFFCAAGFSSQSASAEDWVRQVGVTGFVFGMEGEAGAGGSSADVDLSISDVVDKLDGALTLYTDGSNGNWGYWGSFEYLKLEDNGARVFNPIEIGPGLRVKGKFQSEVTILDGGLRYNIADSVELIAGLRYWDLDNQIRANAVIGENELRAFGANDNQTVLDGFVGALVNLPITDRWSTTWRFDIGAGDSDSTYQLLALLNYQINDCWSSSVGYRYLSLDYEDDGFLFDMENEGVEFAVLYRF